MSLEGEGALIREASTGRASDGEQAFVIILERPQVKPARILLVLDSSPSVDGASIYHAKTALATLARLARAQGSSVGSAAFCGKFHMLEGDDPAEALLEAKVCPGTNIGGLLQALEGLANDYDVAVVATDANPTVGPKKAGKLARIAERLGGTGLRVVFLPVGRDVNYEVLEAVPGASKAAATPILGDPWEAAAHALVAAGLSRRVVMEVALGHPSWVEVEAPGARRGREGWTHIPAARFALEHVPLPVILRASRRQGETVGVPVALHILKPQEEGGGFGSEWRLVGTLEALL